MTINLLWKTLQLQWDNSAEPVQHAAGTHRSTSALSALATVSSTGCEFLAG